MTDLLHMIGSGPDQISGAFKTRCGIEGYKNRGLFPSGVTKPDGVQMELIRSGHKGTLAQGDYVWIAPLEARVSCLGCMLKLKPTEKKVLRLMLDHEKKVRTTTFNDGPRFEWSVGTDLRIYSKTYIHGVADMKLVIPHDQPGQHGWQLTINGRELAKTFPVVKDPFDKKKRK